MPELRGASFNVIDNFFDFITGFNTFSDDCFSAMLCSFVRRVNGATHRSGDRVLLLPAGAQSVLGILP
jgi:hypothetical protein